MSHTQVYEHCEVGECEQGEHEGIRIHESISSWKAALRQSVP